MLGVDLEHVCSLRNRLAEAKKIPQHQKMRWDFLDVVNVAALLRSATWMDSGGHAQVLLRLITVCYRGEPG